MNLALHDSFWPEKKPFINIPWFIKKWINDHNKKFRQIAKRNTYMYYEEA